MSITVGLISADMEWRAVRARFPGARLQKSPYGEWFPASLEKPGNARLTIRGETVSPTETLLIFFHGGWGKVAAAGSTQYVIDRWQPGLLINLGTCGGFEGKIERGEIILAERTIIYDIYEQMGDSGEHIDHYSTAIDLGWLAGPLPLPVRRTGLISADRDLFANEVQTLHDQYGAVAGDWESGAIAWVAAQNGTPLIILRGVTDLVGAGGGEAYGNPALFAANAGAIMNRLIDSLPGWLALAAPPS